MTDTAAPVLSCTGRGHAVCNVCRTNSPAVQNTNLVTSCPIYTFEFEVNLLELNPAYPRNPKTLGECIRKARMDRGLTIKQAASLIGVNINVIAGWELKNVQPTGPSLERIREVLEIWNSEKGLPLS